MREATAGTSAGEETGAPPRQRVAVAVDGSASGCSSSDGDAVAEMFASSVSGVPGEEQRLTLSDGLVTKPDVGAAAEGVSGGPPTPAAALALAVAKSMGSIAVAGVEAGVEAGGGAAGATEAGTEMGAEAGAAADSCGPRTANCPLAVRCRKSSASVSQLGSTAPSPSPPPLPQPLSGLPKTVEPPSGESKAAAALCARRHSAGVCGEFTCSAPVVCARLKSAS